MDKISLKDIKTTKLRRIKIDKGDVLKILSKDEKNFKTFGECYFSWINENRTKGWKIHNKMTLNLIVPVGKVRFIFLMPNNSEKYRIIEIGEGKNFYKRITVPPKICFAFKGASKKKSLILNIADIKHSKKEEKKLPLNTFPLKW